MTDDTKPPVGRVLHDFAEALIEVAKVTAFGETKHEPGSWKKESVATHSNAMMRHYLAEGPYSFGCVPEKDSESSLLHATHVAWRALARLQRILDGAP